MGKIPNIETTIFANLQLLQYYNGEIIIKSNTIVHFTAIKDILTIPTIKLNLE